MIANFKHILFFYLFPPSTLRYIPSQTVDTLHQFILFNLADELRFNVYAGKFYTLNLVVIWMTVDDSGHIVSRENSIAFVAKYVTGQFLRMNSTIYKG